MSFLQEKIWTRWKIWVHEYEYEIWKNMNLREHSIWRLSKRRLSRSLERNMKHGYSKRRINQPIKIQIVTFERCNMISIDQEFK